LGLSTKTFAGLTTKDAKEKVIRGKAQAKVEMLSRVVKDMKDSADKFAT
jgi:hypothetical protein